jgi:hypothetical protein
VDFSSSSPCAVLHYFSTSHGRSRTTFVEARVGRRIRVHLLVPATHVHLFANRSRVWRADGSVPRLPSIREPRRGETSGQSERGPGTGGVRHAP